MTQQVSTTPWETYLSWSGGMPLEFPKHLDSGFAYHCTCGMTDGSYKSRSSAYRASKKHESKCSGGNIPLPGKEKI